MKKIFSILFLSMLWAANAGASEIFGGISTKPGVNYVPPASGNQPSRRRFRCR
jgi:hypothetical protein